MFGPKQIRSKKGGVQKSFGSKIFYRPKKLGPKSLVNIGSITTKLFPIWTNVTRMNFAATNVSVTVDIF